MDLVFASDMSEKFFANLWGGISGRIVCIDGVSFTIGLAAKQTCRKHLKFSLLRCLGLKNYPSCCKKFEETGIQTAKTSSSLISQKSFGEVIFVGFKFPKFLDCMKSLSHHH